MMVRCLKIIAVSWCCTVALFAQFVFRYDTKLGIDVLQEQQFRPLWHKRIALVANYASRDRFLIPTAQLLAECDSCDLRMILTPEHGYFSLAQKAGEKIDTVDTLYNVPVYSLYGTHRRPPKEWLDSIDCVVFDLQDIGIRSYTYLATLYNVMDACAEYRIPLIVLDRPNPLGGLLIDGNLPDSMYASFVNPIPVPYIHGCTFGELARMINGEGWLPFDSNAIPRLCSLQVIPMQGWERWMTWEDTDLRWIPTSPHIPTVDAIRGAATVGILGELGIIGIGIGTTLPFQALYHPQFPQSLFAEVLARRPAPGIVFVPAQFTPFYGLFAHQPVPGFLLQFLPKSQRFAPYSAGIQILHILRMLLPDAFRNLNEAKLKQLQKVTGSRQLVERLRSGESLLPLLQTIQQDVEKFRLLRQQYLLYE